jgi:fumarate hydratase class II
MKLRTEKDPLGELRVPADAYYGVQTQRAVENFPISGMTAPPELITATVQIKKAAAEANAALGRLDPTISLPAGCAISSSSTSTRPAPARRTT